MAVAGIPVPNVIISGEDVIIGKPNPACYLLGAEKLGAVTAECLVFEDAPAGITAGETAGSCIAVITAIHRHEQPTRHFSANNFRNLRLHVANDGSMQILNLAEYEGIAEECPILKTTFK